MNNHSYIFQTPLEFMIMKRINEYFEIIQMCWLIRYQGRIPCVSRSSENERLRERYSYPHSNFLTQLGPWPSKIVDISHCSCTSLKLDREVLRVARCVVSFYASFADSGRIVTSYHWNAFCVIRSFCRMYWFPHKGPAIRSFGVPFVFTLGPLLNKPSVSRWFETSYR